MEVLLKKNKEAESLIQQITSNIEILKKSGLDLSKYEEENCAIEKENKDLTEKIAIMKDELIKAELLNGKIQVTLPEVVKVQKSQELKEITKEVSKPVKVNDKVENSKGNTKSEAKPKSAVSKPQGTDTNELVNVSRFDMRIGKILEIKKHDEADSLYVEQVDIGKEKPIQVISGLVKFCTEEELLGRHAVFLVNLKPAKMRGVLSEGMIMCATSPDIVEPLLVPQDVKPGDRVTVVGYEGVPDDVMNPKKKILETVKPDLKVNSDGIATYLGSPWIVNGKPGSILSSKLKDVQIS